MLRGMLAQRGATAASQLVRGLSVSLCCSACLVVPVRVVFFSPFLILEFSLIVFFFYSILFPRFPCLRAAERRNPFTKHTRTNAGDQGDEKKETALRRVERRLPREIP